MVSVGLVGETEQPDGVAEAVADDNNVLAKVLVRVTLVVPQDDLAVGVAEQADLHAGLAPVGEGVAHRVETLERRTGATMLLCEGLLVLLDLGEDLLNVHRTSFQCRRVKPFASLLQKLDFSFFLSLPKIPFLVSTSADSAGQRTDGTSG